MSMKMPEPSLEITKPREDIPVRTAGASCQPLHYIPDAETRPLTALASFPGSGNTWLRYLIQQSTGILTGSDHTDEELLNNGFPGEAVFNASVAVVKTHFKLRKITSNYKKAVLLIRDLKPTIMADFNLYNRGHTGCASKETYNRSNGFYWKIFVKEHIIHWKQLNMDWIHNFKGPLHIVLYEDLRNDLGPTLRSLVQFLDLPLNETALQCTVENNEGLYHRKPCTDDFDPFTEDMNKKIDNAEMYLFKEIDKFLRKKN